jgi:hypothetical protein
MSEQWHVHESSGFTKDSQMFIFKIQRTNMGGDYSVTISYVLFLCSCGLEKLSHEGKTHSFVELHFHTLKCQVKIFIKGQVTFLILLYCLHQFQGNWEVHAKFKNVSNYFQSKHWHSVFANTQRDELTVT